MRPPPDMSANPFGLLALAAAVLLLPACDSGDTESDSDFDLTVTGAVERSLQGEASFTGVGLATPAIELDDRDGYDGGVLFIYWVNAYLGDDRGAVPEPGVYALGDGEERDTFPRFSYHANLVLDGDSPRLDFFPTDGELVIESSSDDEIRGRVSFVGAERDGDAGSVEVSGSFRVPLR